MSQAPDECLTQQQCSRMLHSHRQRAVQGGEMRRRARKVGMARSSTAFRAVKGSRCRRSLSPSRDARLPLPDSPALLAVTPT